MPGAGLCPGQGLADIRFHERREPARVVECARADIDEALFGHDTREHPALAPVAMMVARLLAVQPADHRLARDDFEAAARYHDRCREGASGHALATGAMASHRQQRCLANAEAYLAAAAAAFHRQGPFGHRFLPYQAS